MVYCDDGGSAKRCHTFIRRDTFDLPEAFKNSTREDAHCLGCPTGSTGFTAFKISLFRSAMTSSVPRHQGKKAYINWDTSITSYLFTIRLVSFLVGVTRILTVARPC